jgi:glycolate oxidase FAD binding subunit
MDIEQQIAEKVRAAIESGSPLAIRGGNSKAFYGFPAAGQPLDVSDHEGIVEYDPGELVLTCRAGSRLSEIRATLAKNGQHFPFEPPGFGDSATVGGTVACGFSGPSRPWSGSLRDYLLGVKMVNGAGEVVQYGGQVMKNVAGYDMSRLLAGSMGTLGVLLETSFKVLPLPARELTLEFECDQAEAIEKANRWSGQPLPLWGAFWLDGKLQVRLSGAGSEVDQAVSRLQPNAVHENSNSWFQLREHQLLFFRDTSNLWRISLPPSTPPLDLNSECLLDWGGAQRWYITELPAAEIRQTAAAAGGYATLFRGAADVEIFHPQPPGLRRLQERIRQALDPHGLFDSGRMWQEG